MIMTISAQDLSHITIEVANRRGVYSVAFSPDGSTLASDRDNTIQLWDVATGQEVETEKLFWVNIAGHSTADIIVKPENIFIPAGRCGLQPHRVLCKSNYGIYYNSIAFSSDGQMIAGGIHEPGTICFWNATTGEQLRSIREDAANPLHWINTVAFGVVCKKTNGNRSQVE